MEPDAEGQAKVWDDLDTMRHERDGRWPVGWMVCDGRRLSSTAYPALFEVIGHRYGGGVGWFEIPDETEVPGAMICVAGVRAGYIEPVPVLGPSAAVPSLEDLSAALDGAIVGWRRGAPSEQYLGFVSLAAERMASRFTTATDEEAQLRARVAKLEAQLPVQMPDATIVFVECVHGHGRLTATNWVQYECPTCRIRALEANYAVRAEAVAMSDGPAPSEAGDGQPASADPVQRAVDEVIEKMPETTNPQRRKLERAIGQADRMERAPGSNEAVRRVIGR